MAKGAIPTPYIIAIIFGVIVLVLVGYWFWTSYMGGSKATHEAKCKTKLLTICSKLVATGGTEIIDPNDECYDVYEDMGATSLDKQTCLDLFPDLVK